MGCTCAIEIDQGDSASFSSEKTLVARVPHRCCECGDIIRPGQEYERMFGVWDGKTSTYKTCIPCAEVRRAFFCTFTFETIWEDFEEEVRYKDGHYSDTCLRSVSPAAREKVFAVIESVWTDLAEMDDDDE